MLTTAVHLASSIGYTLNISVGKKNKEVAVSLVLRSAVTLPIFEQIHLNNLSIEFHSLTTADCAPDVFQLPRNFYQINIFPINYAQEPARNCLLFKETEHKIIHYSTPIPALDLNSIYITSNLFSNPREYDCKISPTGCLMPIIFSPTLGHPAK